MFNLINGMKGTKQNDSGGVNNAKDSQEISLLKFSSLAVAPGKIGGWKLQPRRKF
jgi:hypothetical protein